MAQYCDDINTYMLLTGGDETEAKYMLDLYAGDLHFAVNSFHEERKYAGDSSNGNEGLTNELLSRSGAVDNTISEDVTYSETDDVQVSSNAIESLANQSLPGSGGVVNTISEDVTYSIENGAEVYLKLFNGDIELATSSILQEANKPLEAEKYLSAFNGNVFVAMHALLQEKNEISMSNPEDAQFDIFEAARVYLKSFVNDMNRAVSNLVATNEHNPNTIFSAEECESAKKYLGSVGGDFEVAFNILLQVHQPDTKDEIYFDDDMTNVSSDEHELVICEDNCSKMPHHPFPGNFDDDMVISEERPVYMPDIDDRYYEYNRPIHHCPCGNVDPLKYKQYFYQEADSMESEFVGIYCTRCDQEYLIADVLSAKNGSHGNADSHGEFELFNCRLYRNIQSYQKDDNLFIAGKMNNVDDISGLKRGDHFALDRTLYTHHGIVNSVDGKQFQGIHYQKDEGRATIKKEMINFNEEKVFKVDYGDTKIASNCTKLVIARASSRIGDTGYHLLHDNCEHFSTFCKTGIRNSSQTKSYLEWMKLKLDKIFTETNLKATCRFFYPKGKANILLKTNLVQAGIMIMVEGKVMIVELKSIQTERNRGDINLIECVEKSFSRIVSGCIDVGMKIGANYVGDNFGACIGRLIVPNTLTNVTAFVGSIVGGNVGHLLGNSLGNIIGNFLGSTIIPRLIEYDDTAVNDIKVLQGGDHIVFYAGLHHPRCHGIVISHNSISHVKVVRSTYTEGVVEQDMKFIAPFYRVIYKKGSSRGRDETIKRARSKLGTNEYSLISFNCKHFAQWCKRV